MGKISLGLLALLGAGAIYYFTTGSTQIIQEMKHQVNNELSLASKQGFGVLDKKSLEKSEHFVLSFDEPTKITPFLNAQGVTLALADIQALKGLKLGVDIAYLPTNYAMASLDMYPLNLPENMANALQAPEDKVFLAQLQDLLTNKSLLTHIDISKLGNSFKGYTKDINETLQTQSPIKLSIHSLKFNGTLKEKKLHTLEESLSSFTINMEMLDLSCSDVLADYTSTGSTRYNYTAKSTIKNCQIKDNHTMQLSLHDILMHAKVNQAQKTINEAFDSTIEGITFYNNHANTSIEKFNYAMELKNADAQAITQISKIDLSQSQNIDVLYQKLFSKGITYNILDLSAKNIIKDNKALAGFNLTTHLKVAKDINITAIKRNPLLALDKIDAHLHIALSDALFALVEEIPQAAIALMFIQPKVEQDKKIYELQIKNGKVTVNNAPIN